MTANRDELVVMTQNIWGVAPLWHRRRDRLARMIGELAPTVVGLQEVRAASVDGEGNQAADIASRLDGYSASFWPSHVHADGSCEGVALLCRDDVEIVHRASTPLTLDRGDRLDRVTQRVFTQTTLRLGGETVDVFVTHLSISKRARGRNVREVVALASEGRRQSGSVGAVLMGDLNAGPREAPIEELSASWDDAWARVHPNARGGTWFSAAPVTRIDYVFVQPTDGWVVQACERAPFAGSDHLGVTVRIRTSSDSSKHG